MGGPDLSGKWHQYGDDSVNVRVQLLWTGSQHGHAQGIQDIGTQGKQLQRDTFGTWTKAH